MLEDDFWTKIRKAIKSKWRTERIENRLSADFPDVVFTIHLSGVARTGLLELKCGKVNTKGMITISHYTEGQRDFAINHSAYLLAHIEGLGVVLFDSQYSKELFKGQPVSWHLERCIYHSQRMDGDGLFQAIQSLLFPDHQLQPR